MFVVPNPFEVIEVRAASENEFLDLRPKGRGGTFRSPRERGHAHVEGQKTVPFSPEHRLNDEKIHDPVRGGPAVPHEIEREFSFRVGGPEVAEGFYACAGVDDGDRIPSDVFVREEPEGESFLVSFPPRANRRTPP